LQKCPHSIIIVILCGIISPENWRSLKTRKGCKI
jgi:hypothetical protein